jgi:hypothetical protein
MFNNNIYFKKKNLISSWILMVALVVVALVVWLSGSLALWLSKKSVFLKI